MPILWRDAMSVGHDAIDADHKVLLAIINQFEASPNFAQAEQAAKKLYKYTQEHFRREEALQQMMRYPAAEAHRDEHNRILDALTEVIRTHFLQKRAVSDEAAAIANLTKLMHDWIIGHVVTIDRKMKPFLGEM